MPEGPALIILTEVLQRFQHAKSAACFRRQPSRIFFLKYTHSLNKSG